MPNRRETFNCLQFKWQVQEEIYRDIKKMNWNKEVEYFREGAEKGSLGNWWKEVKRQKEQIKQKSS